MKHYLLAGLLLATAPTLAQTTPPAGQEVGTIDALDAKNGFRKFKFGTPMKDLPDLQKRAKGRYIAPLELLKIGDVDVDNLSFYAQDEKLAYVMFSASGEENCKKLFQIFLLQYGTPKEMETGKWAWQGQVASMTYQLQQSTGGYVSPYVRPTTLSFCTVIIMSNNATIQSQKENVEKLKKAGSDL